MRHDAPLTAEIILAHPALPAARRAYIEAYLGLCDGNPFHNRLMMETARTLVLAIIMVMHAAARPEDRTTWPTLGRLKAHMAGFGVSSGRRIDALVARFRQIGFLTTAPAPDDRRTRLLLPTEAMLAYDRSHTRVLYMPLATMFPGPLYQPFIDLDPAVHLASRRAGFDHLISSAGIVARNPDAMLFGTHDGGYPVMMVLIAGADGEPLSYAAIADRFGISRTHVRNLVLASEARGLVRLQGRGGHRVDVLPQLVDAFDRFMADIMVEHDSIARQAAHP
jgi:biotin operon repressor